DICQRWLQTCSALTRSGVVDGRRVQTHGDIVRYRRIRRLDYGPPDVPDEGYAPSACPRHLQQHRIRHLRAACLASPSALPASPPLAQQRTEAPRDADPAECTTGPRPLD